ncbi:MAG: DUF6510 family protein [Lapillicoccus sp.]
MSQLDGNTLAGILADTLGLDLTDARGRCAGCGIVAVLATTRVFLTPMGTVARCRTCDHVLLTVVSGDGRTWIGLAGISAIEV